MNKIKLYLSLITLVMFTIFSCDKMDDFHLKYIEDGEIRYTTKVDSVVTFAGNYRVKITGILFQPFGVNEIKIYYNDFNDSILIDYTRQEDIDTLSIMLDNLEEKSYSFNIYTGDQEGNRSIKVTAFGTAYGDLYQESLLGRAVNTFSVSDYDLGVNWLPADELERGTELVYTDTSGTEITLEVSPDSSSTTLYNFSDGIKYRSLFVPEKTALDSFASDWTVQEIGIYASTGTFTHPITGTRDFSLDKILQTVITGSVYETEFADLGSYGYKMKLKVNTDNSVEIISSGSTPPSEPDGVNVYDPVTETFTLHYKYTATGGYRTISETIVKK